MIPWKIVFFCTLVGTGIGLFPLLSEQASSAASFMKESVEQQKPKMVIHIDERKIAYNGIPVEGDFMNVNGAVYIPVRSLEKVGGKVDWDEENRMVEVEWRQ